MMDYWTSSLEKNSLIGVRENGQKLLVKSQEEYTSPIQKLYKSGNEFIVVTENSIYINLNIPKMNYLSPKLFIILNFFFVLIPILNYT